MAGRSYAASPISRAEASALAEQHGRPYLTQALREKGNTDPADSFEDKRLVSDELSQVHLHVRQTHGGVPVWGGEAIIHMDRAGQITGVTDDFVTRVNVRAQSLRPQVTSQAAIARAMKLSKITAHDLSVPAAAEQWIYRTDAGDRLAWKVTLTRTDGTTNTGIPVLLIDAETGSVLFQYDNLQTGTGNSMYVGSVPLTTTLSGSTYQLKDGTRGNQQTNDLAHGTSGAGTLFTDADDVWGNGLPSNAQTAAVDAQYGTALTWDYYKNVHGRSGIRGDGVGAYNRVHYSTAYVNAFWDDSCFCMTYGDGTGNNKPLTSIDVAGHEMTHGVTSNTAGLVYSGESGGLNEATSDIMGSNIEFYAANSADVGDYLIGEKIDINGNGTPLRYMDQPSKDGASADCWSSGVGNLDVHYSSGVANHFYYLLSEGSGAKTINGVNYNSPTCNSSTVTGIGRAKAEKIWYRALTVYMTSSTNYAAARTATMNAAADLYGAGGVEQTTVDAAWAAVAVGAPVPPPPPTPLTNGVPVTGISASTGQAKYYSLVVPAGQTTLTFTISGGTGDADLYVKAGASPDLSTYDCRPYATGNSETCTFNNPAATTWYVMLNAYATFSGVTLTGTYGTGGGGGGSALSNGVPVTGLSAATGVNLNYTMAVPSGASNLSFSISGGTGDADLYVKFGSAPTTTSYDCRPYVTGNAETCSFATPQVGTYYVMVRAYASFSGVTLVGQYGTGGGGGGALSNGDFESGTAPWAFSGFGSRQTTGSAHGGVAYAQVGGTDNGTGAVSQSFTVPSTGNNVRFWLYTTTQETSAIAYDHLYVEVLNSSGTVLATLAHYTNLDKGTAYGQKGAFSLAAYAGQTVQLRFRGTSDISLPTVFRVDDVTL
ncbi:MAG TPA: M4 family metallopeptidase, partial [Myxococcaceae bacterium]|nr:M4 family metallopeptidase [Myxococcaceae bacterium]